jgi:hypothetical protein
MERTETPGEKLLKSCSHLEEQRKKAILRVIKMPARDLIKVVSSFQVMEHEDE